MRYHKGLKTYILLVVILYAPIDLGASSLPQDSKLDIIRRAIIAKGAQWTAGETSISRLSTAEFKQMLGDQTREIFIEPMSVQLLESYPESIDWRNRDGFNYVTSVKNQGQCGSCVAFAAVAALESLICIEMNRPNDDIDLSEMTVLMCGGGNCIGWNNQAACNFLSSSGAPDEFCWPYVPIDSSCSEACSNRNLRAVKISYYGFVAGEEPYKACLQNGPIMASMVVYEDFQNYQYGIYEHVSGEVVGGHSICIIGYGISGNIPYWIVKNSWGDGWGNDGYGKIKMGECTIDSGAFYISGAIPPSLPSTPSDLHLESQSNGLTKICWNDVSNNEMKYEVHRQIGGGIIEKIADVSENSTSYTDSSASGEMAYLYCVCAANVAGSSDFSNSIWITTPPISPTDLTALLIDGGSSVRLEWYDRSIAEAGFEIWQQKDGGSWSFKTTIGPDICMADITDIDEYCNYCFRINAYNENGTSAWSNYACIDTLLFAPSDLVTTVNGSDSIYVYWHDNSSKESGFEIWQQQNGGEWAIKATVSANVTLKEITGLISGNTYCYKVRAFEQANQSPWSNTSCATTPMGVPNPPSNLRVTSDCWQLGLTWNDNSNDETGFKIYRQSGGVFYEIGEVGPNCTAYVDADLFCGLLWCYYVRAFNLNGNSPACPSKCQKTKPCYLCQGQIGLVVLPDRQLVNSGETVTFTYTIINKGSVVLNNIEVLDSENGQIVSNISLKSGETAIVRKSTTITKRFLSTIEAAGTFTTSGKEVERVTAYTTVIVDIR